MRYFVIIILITILAGSAPLRAQAPSTISYQGYLEQEKVPVDSTLPMIIRLYTTTSGGSAAWSQSFGSVVVTKGVYTLLLDVSNLSFDSQYWLETEIGGYISSARTPLTSVPYSLGPWSPGAGSTMADPFAKGPKAPDGTPVKSIYYVGGNVGIGTNAPTSKLEIAAQDGLAITGYQPFLTLRDNNASNARGCIQSVAGGINLLSNSYLTGANLYSYLVMSDNGNVGIGTATPGAKLEIASGGNDLFHMIGYEPFLTFYDANHGYRKASMQSVDGGINLFSDSYLTGNNTAACMRMSYDGNVGIGTVNPLVKLEVVGRTKTQVLEISGGSDFSENFDISDNATDDAGITPGMIVSIDPDEAGKLRITTDAYDTRVAGVISGAGGITTGMIMGQQGSIVNGKYPVALSGRVYCWADASTNPIGPGDMLTSSAVPGHAMKATDQGKRTGAVIGKAMTALKGGKGLVLVLVNLQ